MILHNIELAFILLALSIAVTAVAKKAKKPYPIALVIIGAIIGLLPIIGKVEEVKIFFAADEIFRTAVIAIFLPILLGEASLNLSFSHIRENKGPILILAIVGTLLAFLVTGSLAKWMIGLPLRVALVFGALMAATDPVSVISVFKSLGVNRKLAVIMEGESLANDGIAVVLFNISAFSLVAITGGGVWGALTGVFTFLKVALGGAVVGLAMGFLLSQLLRYFDDYPLENSISVVLFYGAYFLAEVLGVSGVIAVVAAGLVLGNYGTVIGMSPTTRLSVSVFWDTLTLVANSLVFILVGLEISRIDILGHINLIALAIIAVLLGRSASVYLSTIGFSIPFKWKHILNWGGLKGSLSLALALSLPIDFPSRETLIALTFGVVFFSLVAQGLTIAPLIRALGLQKTTQGLREYELLSFELQQTISAKEALEGLRDEGRVLPPVYRKLKEENNRRLDEADEELNKLFRENPELLAQQEYDARKKMLYAEHQAIDKLMSEGVLSDETGEQKKESIFERLEELDEGEI